MQSEPDSFLSEHEQESPLIEQLHYGSVKRIPLILQSEAAECGLACLAMVAGHYGYVSDLPRLRQRFSVSMHGINMAQLLDIAETLKLTGRALQLEVEELHHLQRPCILHWDMNHFVVLKGVKRNSVCILDPAMGERHLTHEEFSKHFTGIALELAPSSDFEVKHDKQTFGLTQLWSKAIGLKRSLTQLFILSLCLQLMSLAAPFYMQTVVDDVLLRNDDVLLLVLAIGFTLLMLIQTATNALRSWLILHLSSKLGVQIAANLFRHLIHLPMDWFEKRHLGDIVSRFHSVHEIKEFLTTGVVGAILDGMMAMTTLGLMFLYEPSLSILVLVITFFYILTRLVLYRPFRQITEEVIVANAREESHFMETMRAMQTIKLFQKEASRQNAWQNRLVEATNLEIRLGKWQITYQIINRLLFGLENILLIYLAASLVMESHITVGMLFAFISYKSQFTDRVNTLVEQLIEFKMLGLHLDRLADITLSRTEPALSTLPQPNKMLGHIEVRNLSYRYGESEPPIFSRVNFTITPGEKVALVGPSGSGKTTLLKCLMGLLQPTEGTILIDGKPIKQNADYRRNIAAVLQDDQLLSGSVAENIASFESVLDMEKIQTSAQAAVIDHDVISMTMQYNTLVGDMGMSLSGGQKQRLIIARALYRQPSILFMDEATSHLDIANEAQVVANLNALNITQVIIAHRLEAIRGCRVIKLAENPSEYDLHPQHAFSG